MKIKTTKEIVFKEIRDYFPDDRRWNTKKWVDYYDLIKELDNMIESVELAGYDNPIDESYRNALLNVKDAITSDSRSSNEDSLNTDYDFGSKKEPQPKGKDASHPSHNQ